MNGRLYDPAIGRFISADPTIQYPDDMQNYNRYSYINNNPLAAVDYSGYGWNPFKKLKKLFKKLFKAVKSILRNKIVRLAVAIAIATFAPEFIGSTNVFGGALTQYADVIAGGMSGLVSGRGDLRAAIQGAVTAGAMGLAGDIGQAYGSVAHLAAHATVGCASSVASGGSCGSGALSGGFGAATAGFASSFGRVGGAVVSSVIGGTASVLGGGKFENGAITGAFGYLFNYCAHDTFACSVENAWEGTVSGFNNTSMDGFLGSLNAIPGGTGVGFAISNVGKLTKSGVYILEFESSAAYVGKGLWGRMESSIDRIIIETGDVLKSSKFIGQSSTREALKTESRIMHEMGGPKSVNPNTRLLNKIRSPGDKYRKQDGEL